MKNLQNKKIAILTLNPGVDKIIYLDSELSLGQHNRYSRSVVNQGSKGANQAIVLKNLGLDPHYFSFTGGIYKNLSESFLRDADINCTFVDTSCGVRLNVKIIDKNGVGTEINESGGPVSTCELDKLCDKLFEEKFDIISLCGSFPQGVENNVYNSLITRAKLSGAKVFLDASGDGLRLGCKASPYLIKPNRDEIKALGFGSVDMCETAYDVCGKVFEKYGCRVILTLDKDGSVYVGNEGTYRIEVSPRQLLGFSGAGDSYIATFIYAHAVCEMEISKALEYAAAASCAKIGLVGTQMPTKEQIDDAIKYITVTKIR